MFSFIIISKNIDKRNEYVADFCAKKGIGKFDIQSITPEKDSFGIEEVRNVQKTAYLAPRGDKKVIVLENAHTLTIEAQNALLKILEEPPSNTYIFLSGATDAYFLPTILSRCKLIFLEDIKQELREEEKIQYTSILAIQTDGTIGQRLAIAEELANKKEELELFFSGYLFFLREKMLQEPQSKTYPVVIKNIQEAFQLFQTTNVSPRETLEHLFLITVKQTTE